MPIYGGQDYQVQFRQLDRGVHVVVGTPGRVMDHINRGSLKLDALRGLVLDEADEMLQMGFADDVDWVLTQAPAQRQIALFSATMPESIRRIAQRHLRNPAEITIKQKAATADTVRQRFVVVNPHQKRGRARPGPGSRTDRRRAGLRQYQEHDRTARRLPVQPGAPHRRPEQRRPAERSASASSRACARASST